MSNMRIIGMATQDPNLVGLLEDFSTLRVTEDGPFDVEVLQEFGAKSWMVFRCGKVWPRQQKVWNGDGAKIDDHNGRFRK
jgi:hypothetical protein